MCSASDWLVVVKLPLIPLFLGDECGPYWNMKATFVCFCEFCGCARSSSVCSYKWLQHINCRVHRWAHCLCPEMFPFSITTNHCSLHFFNTPKIFSLWNDFFFFFACGIGFAGVSFMLAMIQPLHAFPLSWNILDLISPFLFVCLGFVWFYPTNSLGLGKLAA